MSRFVTGKDIFIQQIIKNKGRKCPYTNRSTIENILIQGVLGPKNPEKTSVRDGLVSTKMNSNEEKVNTRVFKGMFDLQS